MNYIAILVAAAASIALGFLWYGPLFGKKWRQLQGWTKKDMDANQKGMGMTYFWMVLSTLITAYVMAMFLEMNMAIGFIAATILAAWIWLGFVGPNTLGSVLWEKKPWKLWFLNNAYNLLNLIIIAVVLNLF